MGKPKILLFLLCMLAGLLQAEDLILHSIDQLRWTSRVILVEIENDDADTLIRLENAKEDINERHINWFVFSQDSFYSNYKNRIGKEFRTTVYNDYLNDTNVVLLGKDGYIKLTSDTLELDKIFELIDTMPMRQMEMTSQSE